MIEIRNSPGVIWMNCFTLIQPLLLKPKFVQKSSFPKGEVDKKQKRPGLKKFEVGPPAAKRHVGKQKPVVVGDGFIKEEEGCCVISPTRG